MNASMTTQTQTTTRPEQDHGVEMQIQQLRELFADAPELGKKALENALRELKSEASDLPPPWKAPAASAPVSARCRS